MLEARQEDRFDLMEGWRVPAIEQTLTGHLPVQGVMATAAGEGAMLTTSYVCL